MKHLLWGMICFLGGVGAALADTVITPPSPYVGAFGFEVFTDRIQYTHMWRRTQELMQEVSLTREVLLRLGPAGKAEAGNNFTTRLVTKTADRPDVNLILEGQSVQYDADRKQASLAELETLIFDPNYQTRLATDAMFVGLGVCYDTKKGKCFEEETGNIGGIFGDFYGAGGRFDAQILGAKESGNLKDFEGQTLTSIEGDLEPFMPASAQFYQYEDLKNLEEWQQKIIDNLQVRSEGERDKHLIDVNKTRRSYRKNAGRQGVAITLKNIMNLSPIDVSQTIFKKMLNSAYGLRGLFELSTHMILHQQGLIEALIANQSLGGLRVTGTGFATKTVSKGENETEDYSDIKAFYEELKNNDDILWGPIQ